MVTVESKGATGTPRGLWLEEYSKESTKRRYARDFDEFLAWAGTTDIELVEQWKRADDKRRWAKERGALVLKYYNWLVTEAPCYDLGYDEKRDPRGEHLHRGMSVNTARAKITSAMAFFRSQCDPVRIRRGAFPRPKIAVGEHEFTQDELKAAFHYGGVKGKAVLATAVALGWGADDFLKLRWSEIGPLLDAEPFTGFWHERGKTGAMSRSHLTPEAVDSLRAWRKIAKSDVHVFTNGGDKPWTNSALNYTVGEMVKKAGIKPRGKVHFHLFRKFLIRQLSNAGLNRYDINFMVGKQVPADMATYFQQNVDHLKAKYESAYPRFSLAGHANNTRSKLEELEARVKLMTAQLKIQQSVIEQLMTAMPEDEKRRIIESVIERLGLRKPRVWKLGALVEAAAEREAEQPEPA